jgi:Kef-type K+ transport system membrane component KefB
VTLSELADFGWIAVAAVLAPILAGLTGRLAVPGVVMEILLGIVIGPSVLQLANADGVVLDFSNLGLAFLMFLAGYELEIALVRGRPLNLAVTTWVSSMALAAAVGLVLLAFGHRHGNVAVVIALGTTALGTLLPALRDSGLLGTDLGRFVLAAGTIGEFGPIVLIALLLGHHDPVWTTLLLVGFAVLAAGFAFLAHRPWGRVVTDTLRRGLHSSSQLPVRISMLMIVAFVLLARHLGIDLLLGTFVAGAIVRVAVSGREETEDGRIFRGKLEAIGFGFVIPIFFVVSGMRLDFGVFDHHRLALLEIPDFLVLLFVVRGLPNLFWYRGVLAKSERWSLAVLSATGLPLIVVATSIGVAEGVVSTQTAAALVTAGVLSVLIFPAVGIRLSRRS